MPAKKEATVLQKTLLNQEQWDEMLATEGLTVIDIYQKWCGPCKAVQGLFRRLKNEIGDDLLHYATAEADGIETLERYRSRCEPCFLFYGGGELIDVVRGASAPGLQHSIIHQLAAEHKVLEEGAERAVIKDPILAAMEKQEKAAERAAVEEQKRIKEEAMNVDEIADDVSLRPVSEGKVRRFFHAEGSEPVPKQVTVVLIKPDAVKAEKIPEIVEKIISQGMDILVKEEKTLTEDEAREFYKDQADEDHFEELVTFMASGPSCIMVLTKGDTGEGVVEEIREVIGPKDVEVAKTEAPDSLRAMFGTDKTMNALHGADSAERAARELSFFFPSFVVPNVPGTGPPPTIQKTLALIRPDALKQHKDAIIEKIQAAGFEVCLQKEIQLTEEQAKEFYKEQEGQEHFDELIQHMINGPVLALGLAKEEAIKGWRNLLGPTEVEVAKEQAPDSLRAQFSITDSRINSIHGSDSLQSAEKELDMFFPKEHTLAVIKPDATTEHKDAIIERITEAGFNIACQKHIHMDQDLATQLYKEHEGKEFYNQLISHMTSGPSMVMVLSREDAIDNWRTLMGPTDPNLAKEQAPESLRALLGKDILQNAIHGSSTKEHAVQKIKELFPEVEVTETGNIRVPPAAEEKEANEADTTDDTPDQGADGPEKKESVEDSKEEAAVICEGRKENQLIKSDVSETLHLKEESNVGQMASSVSESDTSVSGSSSTDLGTASVSGSSSSGSDTASASETSSDSGTTPLTEWEDEDKPDPPSAYEKNYKMQLLSKSRTKTKFYGSLNVNQPQRGKRNPTLEKKPTAMKNFKRFSTETRTQFAGQGVLAPTVNQKARTQSVNQRVRIPSVKQRVRIPSVKQGARTPSVNQGDITPSANHKARTPSTIQRDRIPSVKQGARSLSANQRVRIPSVKQGARTPSVNQGDITPSANHKARTPSTIQRDRIPSVKQGARSPSANQRDRSPSANQRDRSPSSNQRDRSPSANQRARTPSVNQRARTPSVNQGDITPSANHKARTPSANQRARNPSVKQGARTPSVNQRARSPSVNLRARNPSVKQGARIPSVKQGARTPSAKQRVGTLSGNQVARTPSAASHGHRTPSASQIKPSAEERDVISAPSADKGWQYRTTTDGNSKDTSVPVVETNAPVAEANTPEATEESKQTKADEEGTESVKADDNDPTTDAVEQKEEPDVKEDDVTVTDGEAKPEESKPEEATTDESKPADEEPKPEDATAESPEEAKVESTEEVKTEGAEESKEEEGTGEAKTESAEEPKAEEEAKEDKTPDEPAAETTNEPAAETTDEPATETAAEEKQDDSAENGDTKPADTATAEPAGDGAD